jgi:hypothetical protein
VRAAVGAVARAQTARRSASARVWGENAHARCPRFGTPEGAEERRGKRDEREREVRSLSKKSACGAQVLTHVREKLARVRGEAGALREKAEAYYVSRSLQYGIDPASKYRRGWPGEAAGILREAARTFRLQQPRPDISLYGTVQRLKREHEELDGHVTLKTVFDDHEQTVRAVLDRASYECALRAHQEKRQIVASGDLKRVGQRWWLENAHLAALPRMDAAEEEGDAAPSENAA